jgi:adenine/guanine phosphoribosyltransferase-like PRPP-binding protein
MTHTDTQSPTRVGDAFESSAPSHADVAADMIADLNERVVEFAKARPVVTIVGALAAGFILGKLAARI